MNTMASGSASRRLTSTASKFAILGVSVLLVATWFLLRYGGRVGDNDTFAFTRNINATLESATIAPPQDFYPNGYGFSSLAVSAMQISGLSMPGMQVFAAGLLVIWLIFPAWLFYRELTATAGGATLAGIILFVQPEFLFMVLRGTHEKFTRGLMFLCLYFFVRGLRSSRRPALFTSLLLSFYLVSYGLIAFNIFQATSFILAMGTALGLTWSVIRLRKTSYQVAGFALRRLGFAVVTMLVISFIFVFYIYPPAQHSLSILESVSERVARLVLDVEGTITGESYQYINFGWVSLPVYFVITIANWLTLLGSAIIWLWWTWRWFRSGYQPQKLHELLLWSFYGAFTFLGVLSILVDISGTVIGNLQHRIFPTFIMLAAPLIAWWLVTNSPNSPRVRRSLHSGLWVLIGLLALLSTLKATNEPLVSNKWTFYLSAEREAIQWADSELPEGSYTWVSFDERLITALGARGKGSLPTDIHLDVYDVETSTRDFLISDINRRRSLRLGVPLPFEADSLITYDNGQAQIYHIRSRTPFQK
jgi:hypothetical protein